MIRCDKRDVGFPDSDLTDLRGDWERIDLSQVAWLAIDKHNVLQGYGAVLPWSTGVGVAVEGENETACKLYESAGMRVAAHLNEYSKKMP